MYLVAKALTGLAGILQFQGVLNQNNWIKISYVVLINDLALLCLIVGCSVNLLKWLVILNRVYFYSGNRTQKTYLAIKYTSLPAYCVGVAVGSGFYFSAIFYDFNRHQKSEDGKTASDVEQSLSYAHLVTILASLSAQAFWFVAIGCLLVSKLK